MDFFLDGIISHDLIETHVTVPIDVKITPLICLGSFKSCHLHLHLSPPSHLTYTYDCNQKYIHVSIHTQALLFEPVVSSCVPFTCKFRRDVYLNMYTHFYLLPYSYTPTTIHQVVWLSPSSWFLSSVSTNFIDTYVTVPMDGRTTWKYAYPLFPSVSVFL